MPAAAPTTEPPRHAATKVTTVAVTSSASPADAPCAPDRPLPPCPTSSPSLGEKEGGDSIASSGSTDNLSSIPKTEVEVFEFREVESRPAGSVAESSAQTVSPLPRSPAGEVHRPVSPQEDQETQQPMDLMDEVEAELAELAELDNLSNRSSACDCPAHVHDREFPLEIAKGHEAAFDHPEEPLHPPPQYRAPTPPSPRHSPLPFHDPTSPTGTPYLPPNYSYGCLMKKWSL